MNKLGVVGNLALFDFYLDSLLLKASALGSAPVSAQAA